MFICVWVFCLNLCYRMVFWCEKRLENSIRLFRFGFRDGCELVWRGWEWNFFGIYVKRVECDFIYFGNC